MQVSCVCWAGAKVSVTSKGLRIVEKTGTSLLLDSAQSSQSLCSDTQQLVDYTEKVRQQTSPNSSLQSQDSSCNSVSCFGKTTAVKKKSVTVSVAFARQLQ